MADEQSESGLGPLATASQSLAHTMLERAMVEQASEAAAARVRAGIGARPDSNLPGLLSAIGQRAREVVEVPGRAMQEGITTEAALPWGREVALNMLGVGGPASMLHGGLGAAGGKPGGVVHAPPQVGGEGAAKPFSPPVGDLEAMINDIKASIDIQAGPSKPDFATWQAANPKPLAEHPELSHVPAQEKQYLDYIKAHFPEEYVTELKTAQGIWKNTKPATGPEAAKYASFEKIFASPPEEAQALFKAQSPSAQKELLELMTPGEQGLFKPAVLEKPQSVTQAQWDWSSQEVKQELVKLWGPNGEGAFGGLNKQSKLAESGPKQYELADIGTSPTNEPGDFWVVGNGKKLGEVTKIDNKVFNHVLELPDGSQKYYNTVDAAKLGAMDWHNAKAAKAVADEAKAQKVVGGLEDWAKNTNKAGQAQHRAYVNPPKPDVPNAQFPEIHPDITGGIGPAKFPLLETQRQADRVAGGYTTPSFRGVSKPPRQFPGSGQEGQYYSTESARLADKYAKEYRMGPDQLPQIQPLVLDTRNYLTWDAEGRDWTSVNRDAIRAAKKQGKSGVIMQNVIDEPHSTSHLGPQIVYITLDNGTVRSRNARFDPAKWGKNDLLGSFGGAAVVSGANKLTGEGDSK